jgi:hypothetical protein
MSPDSPDVRKADHVGDVTEMVERPYPEGFAWDEAWRQRKRADAAEDRLDAMRVAATEDAVDETVWRERL